MAQLSNEELNMEEEKKEEIVEEPAPRVSNRTGRRLCSHIFQRGPREGQSCPNVICTMSDTLCRTHYNRQINRQNRARRNRRERQSQANLENAMLVEDLPPLAPLEMSSPVRPFEDIIRMRARRQRHRTYSFLHENQQQSNQLLYKTCEMCNQKMEGAEVTLECECKYHLNCYLLVQQEECCLKCGDKINKTEDDYPDCSICLEKVKTDRVKTNCDHIFHKDCIESWVRLGRGQNTNKCPNCRTEFN